MPTPSPGTRIFRLLVRLEGTAPPVWRRLDVVSGIVLPWLHGTLSMAMGWTDIHPYQFLIRNKVAGVPEAHTWRVVQDAAMRRLDRLQLRPGEVFHYIHDTSREWRHRVQVETISFPEPGIAYPRLVAGYGSCPTEDTEGPEDHAAMLLVSEEEEDSSEQEVVWATREDLVHPNTFDLRTANQRFQKVLKAKIYA